MKNKQLFVNEISLLYSDISDTFYWFKIIAKKQRLEKS
jgi:hypothetical protein